MGKGKLHCQWHPGLCPGSWVLGVGGAGVCPKNNKAGAESGAQVH